MVCLFGKDLDHLIRTPRSQVSLDGDDNSHMLLLLTIEDACCSTEDPKKERLYLESGIELTGLSAEELSCQALRLGFSGLADAYREYSQENR